MENTYSTPEIKEIIIDGEKVLLSKSKFFGWGVVYPIKNQDGSFNWKNLIIGGNYFKAVIVWLLVLLVLGAAMEYVNMYQQVQTLSNQTCINLTAYMR